MLINLYHYRLPLTMPLLINGASVAVREGFYAEIDGHWGEISPSLDSDLQRVERDLNAACQRLRQGLAHDATLTAVQFGLDCALAKVSSTQLTVEQAPTFLALLEGARDPLVRAWRCRRVHPKRAWLTLTGDLHYDAGLIRELCLLAPEVRLVLDAAGRLAAQQIGDLWARIETSRIDWLLDPASNLAEARALAEQYLIPVAFDLSRYSGFSSAITAKQTTTQALAELAFAKAVLIRPAQLGGLLHCQQLTLEARTLGLEVMLGDSLQSGIGQAQLSHLSRQWVPDAPLALGRCRYLLDSGIDEQGQPKTHGLTPL